MWQIIEQIISDSSGELFEIKNKRSVAGGSINTAYQLEGVNQCFFIKLNQADRLDMFEAEKQALQALSDSKSITVPRPLVTGIAADCAFIVMQYLDLDNGEVSAKSMVSLGVQLAALHQNEHSQFGWLLDNTIGSTPQLNTADSDWLHFWRENRLGYQLELAGQNGYRGSLHKQGDKLLEKMAGLFTDSMPRPALLHGDLWSGNFAILRSGEPIIFDPALYYGDRETDIAMTELFGGFSKDFYSSYNNVYPLDKSYQTRKIFYNIYHILNHLNLFAGAYGQQAEAMMAQVLSELG